MEFFHTSTLGFLTKEVPRVGIKNADEHMFLERRNVAEEGGRAETGGFEGKLLWGSPNWVRCSFLQVQVIFKFKLWESFSLEIWKGI